MRVPVMPLIASLSVPTCAAAAPAAVPDAAPFLASYTVKLDRIEPPAFKVTATWPQGSRLDMDTTRPGDLPVLLERGWPALVTDLRVTDAGGRMLETTPDGAAGWLLPQGAEGPFHAEYRVDTTPLAEGGWPAPREAVFIDDEVISIVGRALFVTIDTLQGSTVTFELPSGWQPHPPWNATSARTFRVDSTRRLRANLIALTRRPPTVVDAGGFHLVAVLSDPWRPLEPQIRKVLRAHARRFVELMASTGQETYVAVLLPLRDRGAESYGQSFALTFPEEPSRANRAAWANLIGHELFHYWNGWQLQGAEYAPSQWFQEGFTEYVANVSTVAAGLMSPAEFRDTLATHVENYHRLETSLEQPGTRRARRSTVLVRWSPSRWTSRSVRRPGAPTGSTISCSRCGDVQTAASVPTRVTISRRH